MSVKKKVILGMSGGVDSSVSAQLLLDAGYDVSGVYLECWNAPGCRTDQDRKDALAVALQLNIPFQVLDLKTEYRQRVVEYFFQEYEAGRTPNPDVMCNKEIKFGFFYDWAMKQGFDAVATGHYAQILPVNSSRKKDLLSLAISTDEWKDQTYFLYRLRNDQLSHVLFPIGQLHKTEVRQLATTFNLSVAQKKDSVGICFIGDINVHDFLRERLGEKPGQVIDLHGRVIGEHQGLWFYTIGQRHGFTVFPNSVNTNEFGETVHRQNIPPFYVIGKNSNLNQLMVGFGHETYQQHFSILDLHWINFEYVNTLMNIEAQTLTCLVRIRHTGQLFLAQLNCGNSTVSLETPTQGIAEGQSVVFYLHDTLSKHTYCLGGAVIGSTFSANV